MNNIQSALWTKLESFQIDEGDEQLTFEKRLARDNGWTLDFSRRVIAEYKKFLFLCAASGHACSPSDEVDEAWHLHILYTRSYWDRLCGQVLPQPLHHNPTKGGQAEGAKFENWYGRTLDSYREVFGQEPPADIWPTAATRRKRKAHLKRPESSEHWVIPKRPARVLAGLFLLGAVAAGCAQGESGGAILLIFGVIVLVIIGLSSLSKTSKSGQRNSGATHGGSDGCGSHTCSHSDGNHHDGGGHGSDAGGHGCGSSDGGSSGCGGGGCGGGCGS